MLMLGSKLESVGWRKKQQLGWEARLSYAVSLQDRRRSYGDGEEQLK